MVLDNELKQLLIDGMTYYKKEITDIQIKQFEKYMELLKEWNKKINLTAIEDDREIVIKHFIDSISIVPYVKNENLKIIDIGTGAGFPGIPLKIVNPQNKVTLLDSLDKRVKFLNEVINGINITQISAIHGRAEDFGTNPVYREKYDIAVARAVANLPVLLEYCLPFVKINGIFIAMKGSNTEEFENCNKALDILGGKIEKIEKMELPFTNIERNVVVVRKFRQTPTKYPRKAGKPSKEPLI
ncbi:16S rRNA (guanine(527)-N(7))-methyltransferase RsmG [Ruminiclostridium cellulolyticum]|uniref:Ribosomal RNA small subunit methyltransferase G n=1 Tax=Ruminiclostridium cellulolyticum (strain ATCC 35319 / DSM 5812 / JCM 6584 / H10) TaxID=394503 RepID=B8I2A8_RUMCH|nr:16S rRNA (guanine(527)-N(7))-methyltransferase RsmG [Ruminiclostridium cellulolyticum]ACL77771.1 methyltransferase GidB [Ruminiclostridium cellulolyticum H10]